MTQRELKEWRKWQEKRCTAYARKYGLEFGGGRYTRSYKTLFDPANTDLEQAPSQDFASVWLKNSKPYAFVYQVYDFDRKWPEIAAWAGEKGLDVRYSHEETWKKKGRSVLIEIKRKEQ